MKETGAEPQASAVQRVVDEQGVRDACVRHWAGVGLRDAGIKW